MNYTEINPENSISDVVKLFWQFENPTLDVKHYTILPDGYFDLIIKIRNNQLQNVSLYGIWTKQINVVIPAETIVVGITFKPIAVDYIFQESIAGILNSFKIVNNSYLGVCNLPLDDFTNFVSHFSKSVLKNININNRKIDLFNLLFKHAGCLTVAELSEKIGWQSRQINRYFTDEFGLSLKTYSTILRCSASYTDIREGDLSPPVGFYDQSHFIKEIKKYTGSKPKELYRNKNDRFLQFSTLPKL